MLYINKFKLFNKYKVMESKQYIVLYVRKGLCVHLIQIYQEHQINLLVYSKTLTKKFMHRTIHKSALVNGDETMDNSPICRYDRGSD
jgi:hypothetical protein